MALINHKIFRYTSDDIQDAVANHEFTEGKKVKIVHKTVQAWLPEADFKKPEDLRDMHDYEFIPMPNVSEITVLRPILWKLAHKIELATQLKTRKMLSATPMQVGHKLFFLFIIAIALFE